MKQITQNLLMRNVNEFTVCFCPSNSSYLECDNVTLFPFSPAGVFEFEKFCKGTKGLMDAVCHVTTKGSTTIIGKLMGPLI